MDDCDLVLLRGEGTLRMWNEEREVESYCGVTEERLRGKDRKLILKGDSTIVKQSAL